VTNLITELGSKRLGLLRELVPGTTVIATLTNPNFQDAERQLRERGGGYTCAWTATHCPESSTEHEIDAGFDPKPGVAQQIPNDVPLPSDTSNVECSFLTLNWTGAESAGRAVERRSLFGWQDESAGSERPG
jgi:hypothetical protein